MALRRSYLIAAIVIGLVLAKSAVFVLDETRLGIVTQFGRPVRIVEEAGLHGKLPQPFQAVRFFDRRLLIFDPKPTEFLTNDKKNVVVDVFVAWRIADPQRFLETVNDQAAAEVRMADIVASGLGAALGRYPLGALITTKPDSMKVPEIMREVTDGVRAAAGDGFGIEIADVRMKRLTFPEQNKTSVFERMRAERDRIAMRYRSEGEEEAIKIRATADRECQEILARAYRDAEKIRGGGDAEAIRLYAAAFNADPHFYEFLRTLESYKKFVNQKTTIVLSADSDLLRYFGGKGK